MSDEFITVSVGCDIEIPISLLKDLDKDERADLCIDIIANYIREVSNNRISAIYVDGEAVDEIFTDEIGEEE